MAVAPAQTVLVIHRYHHRPRHRQLLPTLSPTMVITQITGIFCPSRRLQGARGKKSAPKKMATELCTARTFRSFFRQTHMLLFPIGTHCRNIDLKVFFGIRKVKGLLSRWGIELSEFALVTLQKKTKNKNTLSLCESSRKKGVNLFDSCSRPKSPLGLLYYQR